MRPPSPSCRLLGGLLLLSLPLAQAETLTPLQGQSPEQIQADIASCQAQAGGSQTQSGNDGVGGERLRGAAKGAAVGATAAQIRGNRHDEVYDRVDDDIKQDYRQNQARDAAAVGMAVGGSRQRQERRENRRNDSAGDNAQQAYINCMSGRGYSVTP
ncbi:hypothetical protein EA796_07375 [Pseudomonas sp. AOB-7]|uniref:YMGG-like glycine zipper-containing protein n=1 Tax=Pseudomonas sp. AOB-7 TaxID=2482750 RepID=UPI000EFA7799|nr:YMGG-like glycine zipper-containing protein [Pseudomonas sp. AOB-7]RMH85322.1 hypothetical protein EA796_07375 [Pseudomonas sp. AOB-7]